MGIENMEGEFGKAKSLTVSKSTKLVTLYRMELPLLLEATYISSDGFAHIWQFSWVWAQKISFVSIATLSKIALKHR